MKILIAPLDWGLGHATRCIPLVRYLEQAGCQVVLAAEGAAARLLADNFPHIPQLQLDGYRIRYSNSKRMFTAKILMQVPGILASVRREHRWLLRQQQLHSFDLILSDNRYGLHHTNVPSIILTHQLQIISGRGAWADRILRQLHYRMLHRFHACWVVDEAHNGGLSGSLAHPSVLPRNAAYTGILSQFSESSPVPYRQAGPVLLLLSGPEPMRGQLESLLLQQAANLPQFSFILVAGNPSGNLPSGLPQHIRYYTHLDAVQLLPLLRDASIVVCRSGYSTIMDLAVLERKALLVPTPGQSEQEYLACYLAGKNYFTTVAQDALDLARDIPAALAATVLPVRPAVFASKAAALLAPFLKNIQAGKALT